MVSSHGLTHPRFWKQGPDELAKDLRVRTRDGRLVGRVDGRCGEWLLVKHSWIGSLVYRIPLSSVADVDANEVTLGLPWQQVVAGPTHLPDGELLARVRDRISADPALRPLCEGAIKVSVDDGVVTISGSVPNAFISKRLGDAAREVGGVREVVERLVTDGGLEDSIEIALAARPSLGDCVQACANLGRVTLTGRVDSRDEELLAVKIAQGAAGVRSVRSLIVIKRREVAPALLDPLDHVLNGVQRWLAAPRKDASPAHVRMGRPKGGTSGPKGARAVRVGAGQIRRDGARIEDAPTLGRVVRTGAPIGASRQAVGPP